MKQVKFLDIENGEILGGIKLDNGDIVCGYCGALIEADDEDFKIIREYPTWINISDEIIGE